MTLNSIFFTQKSPGDTPSPIKDVKTTIVIKQRQQKSQTTRKIIVSRQRKLSQIFFTQIITQNVCTDTAY